MYMQVAGAHSFVFFTLSATNRLSTTLMRYRRHSVPGPSWATPSLHARSVRYLELRPHSHPRTGLPEMVTHLPR